MPASAGLFFFMFIPRLRVPLRYVEIKNKGILGTLKHGSTAIRYLGTENKTESVPLHEKDLIDREIETSIINKLESKNYTLCIFLRDPVKAWSSGITEALSEDRNSDLYEHLVYKTNSFYPWRGIHSITDREDIERIFAYMSYKHRDRLYSNLHVNLHYIQTILKFLRSVKPEYLNKITLINLDNYSKDDQTEDYLKVNKILPKEDSRVVKHTNSSYLKHFIGNFLNTDPQSPHDLVLLNLIHTEILILDIINDTYKDLFFVKANMDEAR